MVITKWFSSNTSENVRHSAVKSLYAEGFAGYYRGRHLKETSQNLLLLTPEKSLTIKQYRSLPNNSDGIFSVHPPFNLRSSSVHPPFILRSTSVQPPFELRSTSVHPPFILRSSSVQPPFELRSTSVRAPFNLRSGSVRAPFNLRSGSVRAPFGLRSTSVQPPFELRSFSVRRLKNEGRIIEELSENHRRQDGDVSKL